MALAPAKLRIQKLGSESACPSARFSLSRARDFSSALNGTPTALEVVRRMSQMFRAAQRALRTGGGLNAATPFAARQQVRGMGEPPRRASHVSS